MNIELQGLTQKQSALCEIMWAIDTIENIDKFIASLPAKDQLECRSLFEMMQLEIIDAVAINVDEAQEVIQHIKNSK